jgi:DNA-binding SARP family transcriptional activator
MSGLRLYLLGPPRIERDGVPIQLNRHKDIALVAYLAVTGERHTREALVTLLWPELEPSRARAGLRRNLSALRRMLGEGTLVVDRQSVGLGPDVDLWLDMKRFRQLLRTSYEHVHADGHDCPNCLVHPAGNDALV